MKRRFICFFILLGLMSFILLGYQIPLERLKIWQESTIADFADGQFQNTVLEDKDGGQIRLPHPMQQVQSDSLILPRPRFVEYDSAGNCYATWIVEDQKNVFLQKYNAQGQPLSDLVQVNDISGHALGQSRLAMMKSVGKVIVVWADKRNSSEWVSKTYAQIFNLDLNRIDININVSQEKSNASNYPPTVLANSVEGKFWIFYSANVSPYINRLFIQKCDITGQLNGIVIPIISPDSLILQMKSAVALIPDGCCLVVWEGVGVDGSSDNSDIYLTQLSISGQPFGSTLKINDDLGQHYQADPDIALDLSGNFLVVWTDCRDNKNNSSSYNSNIYGQHFDSLAVPSGDNFLVSIVTAENGPDDQPEVEWKSDQFEVTWLTWFKARRDYDWYQNSWRYTPVMQGSYESSIFDIGPAGGDPSSIIWESSTKNDTNLIRFKFRSARKLDSLTLAPWLGPSSTMAYYTNPLGELINPIHKYQRYIQYRALVETHFIGVSPVLHEVKIIYASIDTIAPETPKNLHATAGHSQIHLFWDANTESDLMAYHIYRNTESGRYLPQEFVTVLKTSTTFLDTSTMVGKTYYYVVTVVDSNLNESSFSREAAASPFGIILYVDDNATSGGDGSKENALRTIYEGLNMAVYGDTVQVLPGTYPENVVTKAGVVLQGSGANVTIIRGVMLEAARAIVVGANDAIFRGFTVIHPGCKDRRPALAFGNCSPKIFDNIFVNYSSDQTNTTAIECSRSQAPIARNLISSFERSLLCYDSSNVIFQNNVILNRKSGYQSLIEIGNWCNPIIRNNTIVLSGTLGQGIFLSNYETESNPIITSNIIFNPNKSFDGINSLSSQQPQLSYNDIFVGGLPYWNCRSGVGDIEIDPKFVNFNRGDFRFAENSPCIDAGNPDPIYNDVDGTRNDMGAFGGSNPINLTLTLKMFLSVGTSNVSGFPGDTVKVSVEVDNAAGIASAQLILESDSRLLTPLYVRKTILTQNFSLHSDFNQENRVKVDLSNSLDIQSGYGNIVDIFYVVNPGAQSEQTCLLKLQSIAFLDGSGSPIELKEITHGIFVVNYIGHSEHVVYVDAKNTGLENGSQKNPFNTINEGINHAMDGDTVVVTGGVYHEVVEIKKGIFLRGAGARVTTIEAGSENEPVDCTMYLKTDRPCEISGFTITNKSTDYLMSMLRIDAPKAIIALNRIVVDELIPGFSLVTWLNSNGGVLQRNYLQGFDFSLDVKNSSDLLLKNNTFVANNHGNASIICRHSQVNIIGNRIEVEGSSGISIEGSSNVTIQNNIIETQIVGNSGIETTESITIIINNTLVVPNIGIRSFTNASSMVIINNVIVGGHNGGWGIYSKGQTVTSYNDVWNYDVNYVGLSPGVGDISANPVFVDSARSDFHLKPGSPCIDAGNPDPVYNDLDGSHNDMGAFGGPYADTTGFLGRQIAVTFVEPQSQIGDTLCIPVTASSVQGISNIEMQIGYNESHLRVLDVRLGQLTQAFSISTTQESPGMTKVRLSSPLIIEEKSGPICQLLAQLPSNVDTTTIIRLDDLVFRDQVDNVYAAAPLEGQITITAMKSAEPTSNTLPRQFTLLQNYPNPFNPITVIRYELPRTSQISLKIYNLLGQEIRALYEGLKLAGNHQAIWDGKDNHAIELPSGLYFCRLSVEGGRWIQTIKLLLVR